MTSDHKDAYWKANLRLLSGCLVVWFVVSFGFGILLVEPLNMIKIGGYKLGSWFAQQGSIYIFVVLVFFMLGVWIKLIISTVCMKRGSDIVWMN